MPLYPLLIAAAFVLSVFTESAAAAEVLPRPLLVAGIATALVQLAAWALVRDRHVGGLIAGELVLLMTLPIIALILAIGASILLVWLARRRRSMRELPFKAATSLINAVCALTLALSILNAASVGALEVQTHRAGSAPGAAALPDIYVILLDGHPRADTIRSDFGFDERPFLDDMESLGFDVADRSRSNYNNTGLTLATMLNVAQIQTLLPDPPTDVRRQARTVSKLINSASGLDDLRGQGYEIVSIPSPFASVTIYTADRVIESGNIKEFELALLRSGGFPMLLPDVQRTWVADELRDRVRRAFDALKALAMERSTRPRFVFAHVMSPHPPALFAADGSPRSPWPCFPRECTIWDGGQRYGDAIVTPTAEQIRWVDGVVHETTRRIIEFSQEPPVIVVLSDHGHRHNLEDRDEMLRSMFMALTPGQTGLFPEDTTPINTLPRILNAYAHTAIPLASEESYWLDMTQIPVDGLFDLQRLTP